jgi:hypothetical protein
MVLSFGPRVRDAADLIARRKYSQAIDLLAEQVRTDHDPRLRLQMGDALVLDGRPAEAVPVYMRLADDYAAQGNAARAIALLKKVKKLDPSRHDVEQRLAVIIKQPRAAAAPAPYVPREGTEAAGYEPSGHVFDEAHFQAAPTYDDQNRIEAAKAASWVPSTREEGAEEGVPYYSASMTGGDPAAAPGTPAPPATEAPVPAEPEPIEVTPEVEAEPIPDVPPTPLFTSFDEDELVAVIQGLRLLDFEPGEIVITQGDVGDSLFVVTSGVLKIFVKDPQKPRQLLVRTLRDGDFFGEISILSGRPRTATVTTATACELLELDKATLDDICARHPRVREVLEEFYVQRASTQEEAMQRAKQLKDR